MNGMAHSRFWTVASSLVVLFVLAPLIVIVLGSFTAGEYLGLPRHLSLKWYYDILHRPRFLDGFIKSIELGVSAALLSTFFGTSAAIAMNRRKLPGVNMAAVILILPIMVPSVIISIALTQFFSELRISTPYITLFVGHTIITLPYVVRTVSASIGVMPRGLEWAAANLGAGPWQTIWYVILPNILPGIFGGAIFAFVVSFDTVTLSIFLQSPTFVPLPVRLYEFAEAGISPVLAAVSTLLIVFTAITIYVAEKIAGFDVLFGVRR